ncbi:50S ribosomal protein L19e [Candidatus Woesearchaeota archaeon]|nr:50S ribosomal protein L19e [Candidatus Woesearchaeota archaeon]
MKLQKRLAAQIMNVGTERIRLAPAFHEQIKEAITKFDIRKLIRDHAITVAPVQGISRVRARKRQLQKRKGRHRGFGVRKGKAGARKDAKQSWILRIRAQRRLLSELKKKNYITPQTYMQLYRKAKGGFFRSVNHIKLFISENELIKK